MLRIALFGLILAELSLMPLSAEARCGTERWPVKIGTDDDAGLVDMSMHNVTRIAAMRSWPAPDVLPQTRRVPPNELKVWVVDATLTAYKVQDDPNTGDSDYHLILADDSANTIIAEIPSPSCVDVRSPFFEAIKDARDVGPVQTLQCGLVPLDRQPTRSLACRPVGCAPAAARAPRAARPPPRRRARLSIPAFRC